MKTLTWPVYMVFRQRISTQFVIASKKLTRKLPTPFPVAMSQTIAPPLVRNAAKRFPSTDQPPISMLLYESLEYPASFFAASRCGARIHTLASSPDAA